MSDKSKVFQKQPDNGQDGADFVGETASAGADGRLLIPAEVRKAVRWLRGRKPVRLVVELVEPGCLRLYHTAAIKDRLDALRRKLLSDHVGSVEHLATFNDRYRPVSYYPTDTRVHLSQASVSFLRTHHDETEYYVEAQGDWIVVMAQRLRLARMARLAADLELPWETEGDSSAE